MDKIADITGFRLFSAEFTLNPKNEMYIIDYANQPIDLRTSESVKDGIPKKALDQVVNAIIASL